MAPVGACINRLMSWQVCECRNQSCVFRFPAEAHDERRLTCPLCGAPTVCTNVADEHVRSPAPQDEIQAAPLHLLLDNIRSTYNVGSLFRTAEGAGVDKLHLCGITPTPLQPKVQKTALGAENTVAWQQHRNARHAVAELRAAGMAIWALETVADAPSLFECLPPVHQPLALVMGSEMIGVDPGVLAECDQVVRLPMVGHKGSLNVASAAAIALYTLRFAPR